MTRKEQLNYCRICKNRQMSNAGLVCKLTAQKADFDETCESFDVDKKRSIELENQQRNTVSKPQYNLKTLSLVLYLIALILPVYVSKNFLGLFALIFGWIPLLEGKLFGIAWLSNILYFVSLAIDRKRLKLRLGVGVICTSIGLMALYTKGVSSYGVTIGEEHLNYGFYVWVLSFLLYLVHNLRK